MAEAQAPLLDLNTLIERPKIAIDGVLHEMLSPDELSILDSQRFEKWRQEIQALAKDEAKEEELDALIGKVIDRVLVEVPDDVRAKLSNAHKLKIIAVFTGLLLGEQVGAAGATLKAMNRSTGARSSRASSASTGGRRATGSPKPPRRS